MAALVLLVRKHSATPSQMDDEIGRLKREIFGEPANPNIERERKRAQRAQLRVHKQWHDYLTAHAKDEYPAVLEEINDLTTTAEWTELVRFAWYDSDILMNNREAWLRIFCSLANDLFVCDVFGQNDDLVFLSVRTDVCDNILLFDCAFEDDSAESRRSFEMCGSVEVERPGQAVNTVGTTAAIDSQRIALFGEVCCFIRMRDTCDARPVSERRVTPAVRAIAMCPLGIRMRLLK